MAGTIHPGIGADAEAGFFRHHIHCRNRRLDASGKASGGSGQAGDAGMAEQDAGSGVLIAQGRIARGTGHHALLFSEQYVRNGQRGCAEQISAFSSAQDHGLHHIPISEGTSFLEQIKTSYGKNHTYRNIYSTLFHSFG